MISARITVASESLIPSPVKNRSAATPVTISGVTRGMSDTVPTTRAGRDRARSSAMASITPSVREPSIVIVEMSRLALREEIKPSSLKNWTYQRVLNDSKYDSDLRLLNENSTTMMIGR